MAGTLISLMASGVPAYLTTSLANVYTPPASTMAIELRHIHICNVTSTACWFSLYIGATGAGTGGTEIFKFFNVPGYTTYDYWTNRKMISTNFLVGIAQTSSSLTIDAEGLQYVL